VLTIIALLSLVGRQIVDWRAAGDGGRRAHEGFPL
jgi:hypothetical protein